MKVFPEKVLWVVTYWPHGKEGRPQICLLTPAGTKLFILGVLAFVPAGSSYKMNRELFTETFL